MPHQLGIESRDFTQRRDQLARLMRLDVPLSEIVGSWAGFGVQGEQTAPASTVDLDRDQALYFSLPTATSVTRRDLHLVSTLGSAPFLAAAVTELLHGPRLGLGLGARRALRNGAEPLDSTLRQLRRNVVAVSTPHGGDRPDDVALSATTVLLLAGTPVALITETVYWRLISHRPQSGARLDYTPRTLHFRGPR